MKNGSFSWVLEVCHKAALLEKDYVLLPRNSDRYLAVGRAQEVNAV